jgi:hypothetical protein
MIQRKQPTRSRPRLPILNSRITVLDTRSAKPAAKAANPFYLTSQWRAPVITEIILERGAKCEAMRLEAAKVLGHCCIRRAAEKGCKGSDVTDIVVACLLDEIAHAHVFDHALAQWADVHPHGVSPATTRRCDTAPAHSSATDRLARIDFFCGLGSGFQGPQLQKGREPWAGSDY